MSLILRTFFVISAEIVNMAPQRCVFERSIFWQIFGITKSTSQGATGNPYRANSEGPGPPGSMTKVMLDWKSYRMKGLPRIQHASEPLARRIIIIIIINRIITGVGLGGLRRPVLSWRYIQEVHHWHWPYRHWPCWHWPHWHRQYRHWPYRHSPSWRSITGIGHSEMWFSTISRRSWDRFSWFFEVASCERFDSEREGPNLCFCWQAQHFQGFADFAERTKIDENSQPIAPTMLRERAARRKLDFSALGRDLASILIASARSQALQCALSGVPGRPLRLSRHSRRTPGTLRDAPETLRRRLRDALSRHGVSREGPGSDFDSLLGAPRRLWGSIFDRFSLWFSIDFASVTFRNPTKGAHSRMMLGCWSQLPCKDGASWWLSLDVVFFGATIRYTLVRYGWALHERLINRAIICTMEL